jgi:hypothetical protein
MWDKFGNSWMGGMIVTLTVLKCQQQKNAVCFDEILQ